MCDFNVVRLKIKEEIGLKIVAATGYYSMSLANFYTVAVVKWFRSRAWHPRFLTQEP